MKNYGSRKGWRPHMEEKSQPTIVTNMLSDPMWVLTENIVVDRIAKKVAEEPLGSGMLYAPMCLGYRKKSKMSFYSINEEFNIPTLSMVERIAKKVAEEPLEDGANKEEVAIESIPRRQSKKMKMREWRTPIQRK